MRQFCEKVPERYYDQCVGQETPHAIPISGSSDVRVNVQESDVKKTDNAVVRYVGGVYVPDVVHIAVGQEVVWVNESGESFWPTSNLYPTHVAYLGFDIEKCDTSERRKIFDACEAQGFGSECAPLALSGSPRKIALGLKKYFEKGDSPA